MIFDVKNYQNKLSLLETQKAIKLAKDTFETKLADSLDLIRVSAPLFVYPETGLNDNLNGVERPVGFDILDTKRNAEIVQSLAKWKRMALAKYNIPSGKGIYTDMNAIRRDEELDNLHSIYVDQWDWEKVITKNERTFDYLKEVVRKIVKALAETKKIINENFKKLNIEFSSDVFFITSEELLKMYPNLSSKERENAICKEHKTVFVMQIGKILSDGSLHDNRAPDYDDWNLNGDILVWYPPLNRAVELSSMGIRVDKESLVTQLKEKNELKRLELDFHKAIMEDKVPLSIGGGIGQSRICLVMLEKVHIGEVQASLWSDKDIADLRSNNIELL